MISYGLQQAKDPIDIAMQEGVGPGDGSVHMGLGSEVHHQIRLFNQTGYKAAIGYVSPEKGVPPVILIVRQVLDVGAEALGVQVQDSAVIMPVQH
jgi:hypothetical protein